jgi:hypothetical protein
MTWMRINVFPTISFPKAPTCVVGGTRWSWTGRLAGSAGLKADRCAAISPSPPRRAGRQRLQVSAFYGCGVLRQVDSDALSLSAAGRLQPICRSDFMEAARVRCQRGGKQHGDDLSVRVHGQLALLLAFLYYGRGNPASGPLPAQRDGSRRNASRRCRAGCQCSARRALIH